MNKAIVEAKQENLSSIKLSIGEKVWGYSAYPHTVLNTEYQESTSIKRTDVRRYEVSRGGRSDGTGWTEYCGTFKKAVELTGFSPSSKVIDGKIQTKFDIDE